MLGAGGAAVVIAMAVAFTPLPDADAPGAEALAETAHASKPPQEIARLPQQAREVHAEQLQSELKQLAESMLSRYPEESAAYHFAAQIYDALKQSQKAEELWSKCIALKSTHIGPYVGLARIWITSGRDQAALQLLEKTKTNLGPSPELLVNLGECQENLGELEAAQVSYRECTQRYPQLGNAWIALGRVQNQAKKYVEAEASLRQAIELDGESEPALLALSTSLLRQKRVAEAAELRTRLAELQPKSNIVDSSFQQQYDGALKSIATSMLLAAAELEVEHGKLPEAAELCLQSISLEPQQLQGYLTLSSIYRKAERYADMVAIQQRLVELQPRNPLNYLNFASVLLQLGDVAAAESKLRIAIALDPQGSTAQIALARLCFTTGQFDEAQAIAAGIAARENSLEAYKLLAAVFEATGDLNSARAMSRKIELLSSEASTQQP